MKLLSMLLKTPRTVSLSWRQLLRYVDVQVHLRLRSQLDYLPAGLCLENSLKIVLLVRILSKQSEIIQVFALGGLEHLMISSIKINFFIMFNMEITMEQQVKSKNHNTKHNIASSKHKFQSDDSEGSDFSYQSSLTEEDDANIGRIQFFKEEMARFFINYPELINKNIIEQESERQVGLEKKERCEGTHNINRNWETIADQILNEAKENSTSLQSLAKRISLYRYKIDQTDLIDLLLQQKDTILKEIEAEIQNKKSQNLQMGRNQKIENNLDKKMKEDNSYLSWRKRKEFQFKLKTNRNVLQRSQSVAANRQAQNSIQKPLARPAQKFHQSLHKSASASGQIFAKGMKKVNYQAAKANSRPKQKQQKNEKENIKHLDDSQLTPQRGSRLDSNWRHLVNFQPKTTIGKQLSDEIKKKNLPSDQLGIKKTIIEYLSNYKMMINNDVITKSTLSQKIQKLYSQQAKELLMFYPSKLSSYQSPSVNSSTNLKERETEDNFMKLLKRISEGPLIKYWRQIQQNKL